MRGKKVALIAIGSALALSFVVFGILFVRYDRGGDPNNEDAILARAEEATAEDNPPLAGRYWKRLVDLNPFNKEYVRHYYHALVRLRDFNELAAYTNDMPPTVEFTADEKKLDALLAQGVELEMAGSNALAVASYVDATNLNYYAAAPFLIDCQVRIGNIGGALSAARAYIKRFPYPAMAMRTAEWCALADRPDLVEETRKAISSSSYAGISLGNYCDALLAWMKKDKEALAKALEDIGADTIKTPVFRMMVLESAADGDDPTRVVIAYQRLAATPRLFDFFPARGQAAVKRFVAAHFPHKLPIAELGRLADLVLEDGHQDIELLRVSLLAKLESDTLSEYTLSRAEERYPDDKGLKVIREGYERAKAKAQSN